MIQCVSHRMKRFSAWFHHAPVVGTGPADVLIEITSHCHLNCPNCRRNEFVAQPKHMAIDLFRTVLEKAVPGLDMAFLFGWGEPFLWPHLSDAIALSRERGIQTNITTSAAFPFTDDVRLAVESAPDMLVIALDSHIPDVYEHYRAGADFEDTVSTASRMIETADTPASPTTVVMQMIHWPEMRGLAPEYIGFARSMGPVEIAIRRSFNGFNGQKTNEGTGRGIRRTCPVLWRGPAYIRTDGTVYPCCLLQAYPLGNIRDASLADLWNGETMQFLRRSHWDGDVSDLTECRSCYHGSPGGYPAIFAVAGCMFGGPSARRWMYRMDRWFRQIALHFSG